ncbi:hypothetical protein EYF80_048011 [Liparis tanakae]|uniref:Uncharacterized protein n=1 Tax=Liparis tanakae TaxID=230148 RepID=A0A4Z2FM39_9TELE|nr:hypothetical protein EYF80_048011 [Liparis tanakae]
MSCTSITEKTLIRSYGRQTSLPELFSGTFPSDIEAPAKAQPAATYCAPVCRSRSSGTRWPRRGVYSVLTASGAPMLWVTSVRKASMVATCRRLTTNLRPP